MKNNRHAIHQYSTNFSVYVTTLSANQVCITVARYILHGTCQQTALHLDVAVRSSATFYATNE